MNRKEDLLFTPAEISQNNRDEQIFGAPYVFSPIEVEVLEASADARSQEERIFWAEMILDLARIHEPNPLLVTRARRQTKSDVRLEQAANEALKSLRGGK